MQISLLRFNLAPFCHFPPPVSRPPSSQTCATSAFPRSSAGPLPSAPPGLETPRPGAGGKEKREEKGSPAGPARRQPVGRPAAHRQGRQAGAVRGRAARRAGAPPVSPHSLCVAGGPGQPPSLLEDEDGACDVVRAALHLVLRQPEELRPPVGEAQGQVRASAAAAAVLGARAASHDAAHEIGHGGFHSSEHITPAPGSGGASRRRRPGAARRGACRLLRARSARAAGPLGRAAPGAQCCCRGPSPGLQRAEPPPLPPATLPQGSDMERAARREARRAPRSSGLAAAAADSFPAPALRRGARGPEPTPPPRGAAPAAATATATVESCDNQAAVWPGLGPSPAGRSEAGTGTLTSFLGDAQPGGRAAPGRRGWGLCGRTCVRGCHVAPGGREKSVEEPAPGGILPFTPKRKLGELERKADRCSLVVWVACESCEGHEQNHCCK